MEYSAFKIQEIVSQVTVNIDLKGGNADYFYQVWSSFVTKVKELSYGIQDVNCKTNKR